MTAQVIDFQAAVLERQKRKLAEDLSEEFGIDMGLMTYDRGEISFAGLTKEMLERSREQ